MKPRRALKPPLAPRLIVALVIVGVASFLVGGLFRLAVATTPPPQPQPAGTATPDLRWYRSLPTASPGCPKSVYPGLEPFYPNCPF